MTGYYAILLVLSAGLATILDISFGHSVVGIFLIGTAFLVFDGVHLMPSEDSHWKSHGQYVVALTAVGIALAFIPGFTWYYTVPGVLTAGLMFYILNR